MADVEAYELDFVIAEHFADPLHPLHVLNSVDLTAAIFDACSAQKVHRPTALTGM